MKRIKANIPAIFEPLFKPKRYKVFYGGRGGGKSQNFAAALIIISYSKKMLILCVRQIQNSIADSVHKLLKEQIEALGLLSAFDITDTNIRCKRTGSEFIFKGIMRNITEIKSTQGVDILWVEEAQPVPRETWKTMVNTIRKDNSEIWVSFNPKYLDDDTYQDYVVNPPDDSFVVLVNYMENPYFPEVLRKEMERDKAKDKKEYEYTWLGIPHGGGGRVWTSFDKEFHVKEFDYAEMAKHGNFYHGQDPHAHYYPANVWMCVFPINERKTWPEDFHFHIYNEWPTFEALDGYYHDMRKSLTYDGTLEDLAKEIYGSDGIEYGFKIKKRGIDTRFAKGTGSHNWSTGTTQGVVEQWAKKENGGLLFTMPQESMIDIQKEVIKKHMEFNKLAPISAYNSPRFSVSSRCKNLIASLSNHRLEEDSEKQSEKYKDFSDAMKIMFAIIDPWVDPQKKKALPYISRGGSAFG